jgi:hypothetical protein
VNLNGACVAASRCYLSTAPKCLQRNLTGTVRFLSFTHKGTKAATGVPAVDAQIYVMAGVAIGHVPCAAHAVLAGLDASVLSG